MRFYCSSVDVFHKVLRYCIWQFSWDFIVLSSMYSFKYYDIVLRFFSCDSFFLWSTFSMKCFNFILILDFFMRFHCSVVDVSQTLILFLDFFIRYYCRCFLWSALILLFVFFLRFYYSVVDLFLVVLWYFFLVSLGHLSYTGDLLLCVRVRRRPSCVNIFFSRTTGPILTKVGM